MSKNPSIRIRPASSDEEEFILSLVPRWIEFGPPPWRGTPEMIKTDIEVLDEKGNPLGFIHLQEGKDYYNHEKHGHIANLIVAAEGEGQAIARMLLEEGEEWAQGYRTSATESVYS